MKIEKQLELHEGKKNKPYVDTVGKITIGIGRNLTDKGLRDIEIEFLFQNDLKEVIQNLDKSIPWWRELSENRRNVLMDMCFNLGLNGLLGFRRFLWALKETKFDIAAIEMLNSQWAKQVGKRAITLRDMILSG